MQYSVLTDLGDLLEALDAPMVGGHVAGLVWDADGFSICGKPGFDLRREDERIGLRLDDRHGRSGFHDEGYPKSQRDGSLECKIYEV